MESQEGPPEGALGEKSPIKGTPTTPNAPKDTGESITSKTDPESSSSEEEGEDDNSQELTEAELSLLTPKQRSDGRKHTTA
ncbi:unnamed protein product [Fusarium equiseti]|uniref:Uncharacterized protein n=1 Tax=Fusarium equiseti TaxID=61235 RepID=A0A8J2IRS1_FUSEQ|nr:unnamed protein product [Fusarium equiseti]